MRIKRMHKRMSIALIVFTITVVVVFNESARPVWLRSVSDTVSGILDPNQLYARDDINIEGNDVLVVVNIPRTGILPLTDHIVRHAEVKRPCSCKHYRTKCQCLNKDGYQWLFNGWNTTGFVCGENASYNDIKYHCPMDYWMRTTGKDKRLFRRYHLITMLREPISRYISEWLDLTTRDTYFLNEPRLWRKEKVELQKKGSPCWLGKRMAAVTLDDFVNCHDNPANNRMTKMLANVQYVDALKIKEEANYKQALLFSAQNVLKRTAYFGLHHRLNDSQALLEEVLGAKLNKTLNIKTSGDTYKDLSPATKHKILMANDLDTKLYAYAKDLFDLRVAEWRQNHNKPSPSAAVTNAAATSAVEKKKNEEEEADEENEDEEEEEEEEEGGGEVIKASDIVAKIKEDAEKEEEEGGKDEKDDEQGEDEDEEDKDEKAVKSPSPKTSTVKPPVATGGSGTKPATSSLTKNAATSGKTETGDKKETKADSGEKSENSKPSSSSTPKTTSAPSSGGKSSGSSGNKAGSVQSTSNDVSLFFSNLAKAKASEQSQKATAKEPAASDTKSLGGSGSGSAQNPSMGEKFRQLQNHPTHKPDMLEKSGGKGDEELGIKEAVKEDNAITPETNKQDKDVAPKDKTSTSVGEKEQKADIEKTVDEEGQTKTSDGVDGPSSNQNLNTSADGLSTTDEFLDPFGLEANLTLGTDDGLVENKEMNLTFDPNVGQPNSDAGQNVASNGPESSLNLVPSSVKLDQKIESKVSSDITIIGEKQKIDSSQHKPDKGFQVDEFNFGEDDTLKEPKDPMTMGDTDDGQTDLLSGKLSQAGLDASGTKAEAVQENGLNPLDGMRSELDSKQFKTSVGVESKHGLGAQKGVSSDSSNMAKGSIISGDLGSTGGLEWGEQEIKDSVSPVEPELKLDDEGFNKEFGADESKSQQISSLGGDFTDDLNMNEHGGSQSTSVTFGLGATSNTQQTMKDLQFGTETDLQVHTMEQGETNGDLKDTFSEGLATKGLEAGQFTGAQNLNMGSLETPALTIAPVAGMQGFGGAPANTFGAQAQQESKGNFQPMGLDFEADQQLDLEQQDFDSPTARFRINQPMRGSHYRVARRGARSRSRDGFRGARMRRDRPVRSAHRIGRRSTRGRGKLSEFSPLTEEEKQIRSMFV